MNHRTQMVAGYVSFAALLLWVSPSVAQELEPRSLTNVPVGTNFALVGYGYATGDLLLDPAVPITVRSANVHTVIGGYVRAIDFFGLSGKVDIVAPFAAGDWEGTFEGVDTATARDGFGDPRVRLSVNFVGAPALQANDYADYRQKWIFGASLQLTLPVGQYDPSKLINLGSNRWAGRIQIGGSRNTGMWILETYARVWVFLDNDDFFGGNALSQEPLGAVTIHAINTLPGRPIWFAVDAGYAYGGRTQINGVEKDTRISTFRFGFDVALPVAPRHTIKATAMTGVRHERGPDFDAIVLTYQYMWGNS